MGTEKEGYRDEAKGKSSEVVSDVQKLSVEPGSDGCRISKESWRETAKRLAEIRLRKYPVKNAIMEAMDGF